MIDSLVINALLLLLLLLLLLANRVRSAWTNGSPIVTEMLLCCKVNRLRMSVCDISTLNIWCMTSLSTRIQSLSITRPAVVTLTLTFQLLTTRLRHQLYLSREYLCRLCRFCDFSVSQVGSQYMTGQTDRQTDSQRQLLTLAACCRQGRVTSCSL